MERAKARVVYDNAEGVATKYETAKGLREGGCVAEVNGEGIVNQKKCGDEFILPGLSQHFFCRLRAKKISGVLNLG